MSRSCNANSSSPPAMTDRMLETDFVAAEVLASLSKSPKPHSSREASVGGGESVDSWGSRNKQSTVQVKSESSPVDSALNSSAAKEKKPVLLAFDLNEDEGATFNEEEECLVKGEDIGLAQPSSACTTSGGKSRQNLTEAEKEARRLRRVLANRESARQTIRRRQALYEELNRKVVDLARENENLKREKESTLKDYEVLERTNKKLNEQVAEQLESKIEENRVKSTSSNCNVHALPFPNYPYIMCKDAPFVYPYNIQVPDHIKPTQLGHHGSTRQSEGNLRGSSNFESPNGKGKPLGHWCMVPCPIFFPLPDVKNDPNLIPFFPVGDRENDTGVDKQRAGTSSSKAVTSPRDISSGYPANGKKEVFGPTQAHCRKTTDEIPLGFSRDVVDQQLRSQPKGVADTSSLECGRSPTNVMREAVSIKLTNAPISEATSSKRVHDDSLLQESHKEPVVSLGKRLVDPAAAAEARKRRKELTKLKTLHCRSHKKEGLRI